MCTLIKEDSDEIMSSNDIKVSVVMPIFNAYNYLRPAMDSVVGQTLKEIEIICIDDGSTDHSLEILKQYQEQDDRIRIVTETNAGPALARNNGIKRARGEYIAFLDADDFYELTLLEKLYETAKRDDLDIAIAKYDIYHNHKSKFEEFSENEHSNIYKPGEVTSKNEHPDYILTSTIGAAWNKLFKRSFIEEKELLFPSDIRMYEDVYFVVTAMSLAERVGKVFETLVHHRVYSEQTRAKLFRKCYTQVPAVYLKIKEFLVSHGMYSPLFISYLNLSASRCYKAFNMLSNDNKKNYWDVIHNEYCEKLGWSNREAKDFESEDVCHFVANVQIYTYDQYKKRCSKGYMLKLEKLKNHFKNYHFKSKLKSFFGKFSSKKKKKDKKDEK